MRTDSRYALLEYQIKALEKVLEVAVAQLNLLAAGRPIQPITGPMLSYLATQARDEINQAYGRPVVDVLTPKPKLTLHSSSEPVANAAPVQRKFQLIQGMKK